jgi:hypothetical protein
MKTPLVNEAGYVNEKDADPVKELTKSRLFFPLEDAINFLAVALLKAEKNGRDKVPPEPEPSTRLVVTATGLMDEVLDGIAEVENEVLTYCASTCVECKAENNPATKDCPGLTHKGDLVQNIVGAALRIGMITLLKVCRAQIQVDNPEIKESSAFELFTPALRDILDGAR